MSSFLQRSKTAPQSLQQQQQRPVLIPRSLSHDQLASKPATRAPDSGAKIWAERRHPAPLGLEDAGASWSGPSEEEWSWMKEHAEPTDAAEDVEDVINSEDKLGVLSVDSVLSGLFKYWSADDRLVSPYSVGESVDEDSLYLHLRSQRVKAVPKYQDGEDLDGLQEGGKWSQLFLVN